MRDLIATAREAALQQAYSLLFDQLARVRCNECVVADTQDLLQLLFAGVVQKEKLLLTTQLADRL
jgi:hypothetical protein